MTPRERILATLERKGTDRTPVDLWHTPDVVAAQSPYLNERQRAEAREITDAFARNPEGWLKTWLQDRQADIFPPPPEIADGRPAGGASDGPAT